MFPLKDVESISSKEKGVVLQTVKDVLKGLVDDGLVDSDKIGTSIYFWAFPSKGTCTSFLDPVKPVFVMQRDILS